MVEVVLDVADDAYLIAVGIDGTALRQPLGVAERDVVHFAGLEEVDALQEVDAEEECYKGYDAHESYLYFCFHLTFTF